MPNLLSATASHMLVRVPEQAGFDHWVGTLYAGASVLDLINGFLVSRGRHSTLHVKAND